MSKNHRYNIQPQADEGLVDEDELVSVGLDIRPFRRGRDRPSPKQLWFPTMRQRVDALLVDAGYEPSHIPKTLRMAALDVAWCWERGLCEDERIANAVGRSINVVRRAARALRSSLLPYQPETPTHNNRGES